MAQSNLTLNDGLATPVAHTFTAMGATPALATWRDLANGTRSAQPLITMSVLDKGNAADGSVTVDFRITVPTLEVAAGTYEGYTPRPKLAYNHFAQVRFVLPNRGTSAERKDIFAYAKNLLANAVATAAVENLTRP